MVETLNIFPVRISVGAATSCQGTAFFSNTPEVDNANAVVSLYSNTYVGQTLNPGATKCVCRVDFVLEKVGASIAGRTFRAEIWTLVSDNLTTKLGSSTGVAGNDLWNKTVVPFSFSSCVNVSSGTVYAFVLTATDLSETALLRLWDYSGGGIGSGVSSRYNGDGTLSGTNVGNDDYINIYAYE